jgi:anthranilate synthase/aminodeoxychorismate synthase-like glutamine amidotransferase
VLRAPCQDCSLARTPQAGSASSTDVSESGLQPSCRRKSGAAKRRQNAAHGEAVGRTGKTNEPQRGERSIATQTPGAPRLKIWGKLIVAITSMVFVLDNYDSFTYNLVQYLGELGAEVVVRRNDEVTVAEVEAMHPERILLSPGPCTPQEAGISIELVRHFAGKVPVLGVCLGHQAIGAAFGGQVVRALKLMHGKTSQVQHDGKTIFNGLPSPMTATRYHSLIVQEKGLPQDLEISAYAAENGGSRVIMGLRHKRFPVEGVQFHPESVLTGEGKRLIANFLRM